MAPTATDNDLTATVEKTIPIQWESWDPLDTMHIQFSGVKFLEDWGPFKSGDVFASIDISFEKGEICVYRDGEESPFQRIRFNLQPISDSSMAVSE